MSNKLDNLVEKRNRIIITLYFVIILSAIVGICINHFGIGRLSKDTYKLVFSLEFYGSQILFFILAFKLYKVSSIIGQDKSLRMQFNDERMVLVKTKSLANGFKAMMYTFLIITAIQLTASFIYDMETIFGYPEIIIAYFSIFAICFIGFTTAFVSYFTLDN